MNRKINIFVRGGVLDAVKAKPHRLPALPAGAYGLVGANTLTARQPTMQST